MYEVTEELKGENYCRGYHLCNFKLDINCAALTTHKIGVLEEKEMDRVAIKDSSPISSKSHVGFFCEEERIPNNDVYYCQEYNGQTTANVEYVLAEVENNIEKNNHEELLQKKVNFDCKHTMLRQYHFQISNLAILALGNITGDSLRYRDLVIGHGALLPLLALFNKHVSLSMLRNATWTLLMFCEAPFDQAKLVLTTFACLIHLNNDEKVLTDACWALSYLSDGTNDKIQVVIEAGVCGTHDQINYKNMGTTRGVNLYAQMIDDAEGQEKIENLGSHDNIEIYEKAVEVFKTYW
ncbi:hypothetical protein J1N35_023477 [Gossypium stocksii]|uniref:IBB domain-containing protein n=1 Tax=Gossypium stocksii TaxID=47602 RepID=A0A9D3VJ81_9ROSI|nr:hypothetical protein J1N35_023477 [Gossypium stocksii]